MGRRVGTSRSAADRAARPTGRAARRDGSATWLEPKRGQRRRRARRGVAGHHRRHRRAHSGGGAAAARRHPARVRAGRLRGAARAAAARRGTSTRRTGSCTSVTSARCCRPAPARCACCCARSRARDATIRRPSRLRLHFFGTSNQSDSSRVSRAADRARVRRRRCRDGTAGTARLSRCAVGADAGVRRSCCSAARSGTTRRASCIPRCSRSGRSSRCFHEASSVVSILRAAGVGAVGARRDLRRRRRRTRRTSARPPAICARSPRGRAYDAGDVSLDRVSRTCRRVSSRASWLPSSIGWRHDDAGPADRGADASDSVLRAVVPPHPRARAGTGADRRPRDAADAGAAGRRLRSRVRVGRAAHRRLSIDRRAAGATRRSDRQQLTSPGSTCRRSAAPSPTPRPTSCSITGWYSVTLVRALVRVPAARRADALSRRLASAQRTARLEATALDAQDARCCCVSSTAFCRPGVRVQRIPATGTACPTIASFRCRTPWTTRCSRPRPRRTSNPTSAPPRAGDGASIPTRSSCCLSASWCASKRPVNVVRAVARLAPGASLMVVGSGPLEEEVRAEAERLGVSLKMVGFLNQSRARRAVRARRLPHAAERFPGDLGAGRQRSAGHRAALRGQQRGRLRARSDSRRRDRLRLSARRHRGAGDDAREGASAQGGRARLGAGVPRARGGLQLRRDDGRRRPRRRSVLRALAGPEPDWSAAPRRIVACCGQMVIAGGLERMTFEVLGRRPQDGARVPLRSSTAGRISGSRRWPRTAARAGRSGRTGTR